MPLLPSLPRRASTWSISSTSQPSTPLAGPRSSTKAVPETPFDHQSLFRNTEKVLLTQGCRVRRGYAPFVKADALLVISKREIGDEAAIFLVTHPADNSAATILCTIPIIPGFKHRLEQTPPSPSNSFFQQSAKPHTTLYLSCEDIKLELRISASQSAKVQKLVAELRRQNDAAALSPLPRSISHSWLDLYPMQPPNEKDDVDDLTSPPVDTPDNLTPSTSTTTTIETPLISSSSKNQLETASPVSPETEQYPDPYLPTFSRTHFLRKRLFAGQDKWSAREEIKIRIATYNVNDKIPPEGTTELSPLVGKGEEDILVFGFQEADLRRQSLLISQGNSRADGWEAALLAGLGDRASDFEKLVLTQYVGVMMMILVRKSLKEHISRVETSERGIGLLGFGGNKAGVAVRMKIHDTTVCFVNAHMAAFATALDRRRSDYQVLRTGLSFPRPNEADLTAAYEEFLPEAKEKLLNQEDSHMLFWLGDLNYRVDLPDDEVKKLVEEKRWDDMLAKDQLRSDIASEQSFAGFSEAEISFPPTFKFVHGSTTHDLKRAPAYTDRIVYDLPKNEHTPSSSFGLKCDEYTSHDILWSDHRPVTATFSAQVRVVDETSRGVELAAVMKELDRLEEVYRPSLEIEGTNLEFGDIRYRHPVEREVKLRNVGRVPATYSFKPPSSDKPICKPFMWPYPATAVVAAGQELTLKVVIDVDEYWSAKLTLGSEDINDVLVLQIAGGKDIFITVQANYLASTISLPLHVLSALPSPVRDISLSERKILGRPLTPSTTNGEAPAKPVRDVWRLLEYLMAKGSGVEGLWIEKGDIREIIESLDSGSDLPENQASIVSLALLHLLTALPTPLLPVSHHTSCLTAEDRDAAFAVLEGVPQINTNVLIGLMSVIRLCSSVEETPDVSALKIDNATIEPTKPDVDEAILEAKDDEVVKEETEKSDTTKKEEKSSSMDGNFKISEEDDDEDEEATLDLISLTHSKDKASPEINQEGYAKLKVDEGDEPLKLASPPKKGLNAIEEPQTPPSHSNKALDASPANEPTVELIDALIPAVFGMTVAVATVKEKRRKFIRLLLEG
ncbi:uncharacterized protein I303_100514 [Kwoniella dejecticola CBS 10117]|uniref:Inositol polyphosphate-related phosphatase domain-containing protein n=1 Tax=Kwoniella dejecticola CBS 10117 TaxID=1296121 RepID=A0A1A6AF45_9TREE|nr:uncharacterized protein I303_00514 [Kwoniella dejecticola CBS 10117]OBR88697.1 hypothetical protein I303_00514 [Kwoniella dejecticola CBS 10117]